MELLQLLKLIMKGEKCLLDGEGLYANKEFLAIYYFNRGKMKKQRKSAKSGEEKT